MSLETDISYVYENAYLKAHYDEVINGYIIKKEDYLPLNLTKRQLNILRKMCRNSKIKLEYEDYRIPGVEDEELFKEYQEIKKLIDTKPNSSELDTLEKRRIEIRNKIVTDNLKLVRSIIDRNFEGIQEIPNKEDIYQLGYEILFTLVNNHSIVVPRHFSLSLSGHLITYIMDKIFKLETGLDKQHKHDLEKLKEVRKVLLSTNLEPTIKDLAMKLEIEESEVIKLLQIEELLEYTSLDDEIDRLETDENFEDSFLYNDDYEKELMRTSQKDFIKKILYTLPPQQREVIMLAYGFKDGRCYNDTEIANIMGVTNARIGIVRQNAIGNLKLSIRANYLKEIYQPNKTYEPIPSNEKKVKEFEEILIGKIPKEQIQYYISELSKKDQTIIMLYYGYEDGFSYNIHSIAKILNEREGYVLSRKNKTIVHIRNKIIKEIEGEQNIEVSFEEYLDYLIKNYIIRRNYKKQR